METDREQIYDLLRDAWGLIDRISGHIVAWDQRQFEGVPVYQSLVEEEEAMKKGKGKGKGKGR